MSLKDFKVLNKLGQGAYSSVYRVQRQADGKQYALKKVKMHNLSDKEQENALNQIRILASFRHTNIIGYMEAFIESNTLWQETGDIIMQFADDGDLYQKIVDYKKKSELFDEQDIWLVLIQVARALKALHAANILHRDLKVQVKGIQSANVFINKDKVVKLGDMNVSKLARDGLLYTQTGTPYYASPEVWSDQPYDSKSDMWSLGCVIYEMTTLRPPFRAEDMEGLYKKVMKGVYPKIQAQFSAQLSSVIKNLLQVTPGARPSAAKLLASQILQRKAEELNIEPDDTAESPELLKTIRIPKNLHYLTDRLPKPNYTGVKNRSMDKIGFTDSNVEPRHHDNMLPKIDSILNQGKIKPPQKKRRSPHGLNILEIEGHSKMIQDARSLQPKNGNDQHYVHLKQAYNVRNRSRRAQLLPSNKNISLPPLHN